MSKGVHKPSLTSLNLTSSTIPPPRKLGLHGLNLWISIQSAYRIDDAGGIELLALACAQLDRVESLAEQIRADGEVFRDGIGKPTVHSAVKDELAGRAFIARTLERLGVTTIAPDSPPGRPKKAWRGPHE
jgi:hypothetical protein